MRRLFTMLLMAIVLVGAAACNRRDGEEPAPAIDAPLMAYLSEARALHHVANVKEDSGDLAGAAAAIERLIAAPRPHTGDKPAPEITEVVADAQARLAELRVKQGELDKAEAAVRAGLELAPEATYFRGHLFEIDGLLEEARAKKLAADGKADEAEKARQRALQKLEEAVRIQEQVIKRTLSKEAGS
jgi:tetratricopeptide (TPR) repeat protein